MPTKKGFIIKSEANRKNEIATGNMVNIILTLIKENKLDFNRKHDNKYINDVWFQNKELIQNRARFKRVLERMHEK